MARWPMVGVSGMGHARRMPQSERGALREIRAAMARLGYPVDDLSDAELRARAIKLIGRERGAPAAVARALTAPPESAGSGLG